MNRKNVNNFIQKFGPDGQVVLHNPYLLLKSVEDMHNDPADGNGLAEYWRLYAYLHRCTKPKLGSIAYVFICVLLLGTQAIHCIWFYEPQDCVATASILRKMGLKFEGEAHDQGSHRLTFAQANSPRPVQLTGNALFQILQKGKVRCRRVKNAFLAMYQIYVIEEKAWLFYLEGKSSTK